MTPTPSGNSNIFCEREFGYFLELHIALLYRHVLKLFILAISLTIKTLGFLTGSDIAGAFALLHEAEAKLKTIVHDKFEAAIQNGDRNSVERWEYIFNRFVLVL